MITTDAVPRGDVELAFSKCPHLRHDTNPRAWAIFSTYLMDKGHQAEATALALEVLKQPAVDHPSRWLALKVLRKSVPGWHWRMVRDTARNAAYEAALARAIKPGDRVLDIGTGSGLLSMMAARLGAAVVFTCETVPAIAEMARLIIDNNGYSKKIHVISKNSRDLNLAADLGGPVDLIVSEVVSDGLLEEGILPVHADAVPRLLRPGGKVIPAVGSLMVALGYAGDLDRIMIAEHCGFDLSAFNMLRSLPYTPNMETLILLSTSTDFFKFNFASSTDWPGQHSEVEVVTLSGEANVLLTWFRLDLDGSNLPGSVIDMTPGVGNFPTWGISAYPLKHPVTLQTGGRRTIKGWRNDTEALAWLID